MYRLLVGQIDVAADEGSITRPRRSALRWDAHVPIAVVARRTADRDRQRRATPGTTHGRRVPHDEQPRRMGAGQGTPPPYKWPEARQEPRYGGPSSSGARARIIGTVYPVTRAISSSVSQSIRAIPLLRRLVGGLVSASGRGAPVDEPWAEVRQWQDDSSCGCRLGASASARTCRGLPGGTRSSGRLASSRRRRRVPLGRCNG